MIEPIIFTIIGTFLLTIALLMILIPFQKKLRFGQIVREEGLKTHRQKQGTPTMGGLAIIVSFVIGLITYSFFTSLDWTMIGLISIPVIGYFLLGFMDDFLIIKKHSNEGISPQKKLIYQAIIALVFFWFFLSAGFETNIVFFNMSIDLQWGYGLLVMLILMSTSNAVNLTDGLDGLAGGLMAISLLGFSVLFYIEGNELLVLICLIMIAAISGFLLFNIHPAKIFMGDTGSLALGGMLGTIAILSHHEWLLFIIGMPYLLETLSVVIQVFYYKRTKKRIFKMAPLHHDLEMRGMKEEMIVGVFWVFGIICSIIGVALGIYF